MLIGCRRGNAVFDMEGSQDLAEHNGCVLAWAKEQKIKKKN